MSAVSAGLLPFRRAADGGLEVLLVHPGGPYWARRDRGAWQIAKGLVEPGETIEAAARREAAEELGIALPGPLVPLGQVRQKAGKIVHAFAIEADLDAAAVRGNPFEMEWPPRSGRIATFPEIDRARWFAPAEAAAMMLESQRPFVDRLPGVLAGATGTG